MHAAKVSKIVGKCLRICYNCCLNGAGSGGRATERGRGQCGRARVPEFRQDQHFFVGENPQIVVQAQKIPHQTPPGESRTFNRSKVNGYNFTI